MAAAVDWNRRQDESSSTPVRKNRKERKVNIVVVIIITITTKEGAKWQREIGQLDSRRLRKMRKISFSFYTTVIMKKG